MDTEEIERQLEMLMQRDEDLSNRERLLILSLMLEVRKARALERLMYHLENNRLAVIVSQDGKWTIRTTPADY